MGITKSCYDSLRDTESHCEPLFLSNPLIVVLISLASGILAQFSLCRTSRADFFSFVFSSAE